MTAPVIHVDWEAWSKAEARARRVSGPRAFVLSRAERVDAFRPEERDWVKFGEAPPASDEDGRLPGMAAWLLRSKK